MLCRAVPVAGILLAGLLGSHARAEIRIETGGDISGVTVNSAATPEPAVLVFAGAVLLGIVPVLRRKFRGTPKQ